jgi:hypothetical protein
MRRPALWSVPRLPLLMLGSSLWVAAALGCAGTAPAPPSATIVSVEGASTTYHTRDWNGKRVTVRVPAQSVADIRGKDAQGNVRATVTAIDPATNRVKVRTAEGQTIVLEMTPSALADLQVGGPVLFTSPDAPH